MTYQWNWSGLLSTKPYTDDSYLTLIGMGINTTLILSLSAWVIALVFGTLCGISRTWPKTWLNAIARVYVETFRSVPLLVQLFIGYFVLPEILPPTWGLAFKQLSPGIQQFVVSVLVLGLFTSARLAEHVRAGLEALSNGQKYAAMALGLELSQAYRFVLLPMAFRTMLPTLTSELLNTFKNTAVCSTIGLVELSYQAGDLAECQDICLPYEAFTTITLSYLVINWGAMRAMRLLEKYLRIPGYIGQS